MMMAKKPKCCLCGKEIQANEHYYLIKRRSVCKKCEAKLRHKKASEVI